MSPAAPHNSVVHLMQISISSYQLQKRDNGKRFRKIKEKKYLWCWYREPVSDIFIVHCWENLVPLGTNHYAVQLAVHGG